MAEELLYTVTNSIAAPAKPIALSEAGMHERQDLQEWVIARPEILGEDVMIVTSEFDRWQAGRGRNPQDRLDILGLDSHGYLVVAELKADQAPDTVEMQALKYAGMVSRFTPKLLASEHARYLTLRGTPTTEDQAQVILEAHAELDMEILRRPRVILLARDFRPSVTSTAVWLNEMGVSVTLLRFQAYRAAEELVLSVSQLYPIQEIAVLTVTPVQARVKAIEETVKRRKDVSAVRRLIEAGSLEDDVWFTLQPQNDVTTEVRNEVEEYLREDARRGRALWRNDLESPLVWELDGNPYGPTDLAQLIVFNASETSSSVRGTKWWADAEGRDIAQLAAQTVQGKGKYYLGFWDLFLSRLRLEHPEWSRAETPPSGYFLNMPGPFQDSHSHYTLLFSRAGLSSQLSLDSSDGDLNLSRFNNLEGVRESLETKYGCPLDWTVPDAKKGKQRRIAEIHLGDVMNVDEWDQYIDWMFQAQIRLRRTFDSVLADGIR